MLQYGAGTCILGKILCSLLKIASIITVREILNSPAVKLSADTEVIEKCLGIRCDNW